MIFFFNYTATTEIYTYSHTLSLHDALPISSRCIPRASDPKATRSRSRSARATCTMSPRAASPRTGSTSSVSVTVRRSEEHTSELQSLMRISYAVFCLKKKKIKNQTIIDLFTKVKSRQHKACTLTQTQ